jgi:hypothetical protein
MKRLLLISAGVLAAGGVAATPAMVGLTNNPSFSHQIPIRVPSQVHLPKLVDDHGTDLTSPASTVRTSHSPEPGDDRGGATRHVEPGDDRGGATGEAEPGDDRGGATRHVEPGDDRGGATASTEPGDDRGRDSGGGTSGGDDNSGRGGSGGGSDDGTSHG